MFTGKIEKTQNPPTFFKCAIILMKNSFEKQIKMSEIVKKDK